MPVNTLLYYLEDNFKKADEAVNHLIVSAARCKKFIGNSNFTEEQLIDLEAVTGRFARLSDILIHKILKTIDRLDGNLPGTVRDIILNAAKKGLITSADDLLEIRDVRNTIAHEYESDNLDELANFVINNAGTLEEAVRKSKTYAAKFY